VFESKKPFLVGKLRVSLRFEQQRFYNPHHHPEMPRTLQSLDRRVGHGEHDSRMHYDQAVLCLQVQVTPEASVTHLREDLLRSVE
jgi:hypothetical protein